MYLNGAATTGQVGVAKSYSVMPGDQISILAYAKYGTPSGTQSNLAGFAATLLGAFGLPTPQTGEVGTPSAGISYWGGYEMGTHGDESKGDAIKAFVTIVLFDRNYKFLDVTYQAVQSNGTLNASYVAKQL